MTSHIVKLSDGLFVNLADLSFAERSYQGLVVLHLRIARPARHGETLLPSHQVLELDAEESARAWEALEAYVREGSNAAQS